MDNHSPDLDLQRQDAAQRRLERLSRFSASAPAKTNGERYTKFIRQMRLILPLIAVCIVVALMAWPDSQKTIALLEEHEKQSLQTIRKNELTNPKFESTDEKNQPYSVTAEKAVQAEGENNIMLLEKPAAKLELNGGGWVALRALSGKYGQESRQLDLHEQVTLTNSDGYQMDTAALFIDLKSETARTETPVTGFGPAGTLQANGLRSDNIAGTLVFTGPAKLVLKDTAALQGLSRDPSQSGADIAQKPSGTDAYTETYTEKTDDITEQPDMPEMTADPAQETIDTIPKDIE